MDSRGIENRYEELTDVVGLLLELGWIPPGEATADEPSMDEERAIVRAASRTQRERASSLVSRAVDAADRAARLRDVAEATHAAIRTRQSQAEQIHRLETEVGHLQRALDGRPHIEHVVGMLMLVMSCSPEVAWGALSHVSQQSNRKVRDIAEVISGHVAAGHGLPPDLMAALRDVLPPRTS